MNKEEILMKSRQEYAGQQDERDMRILADASKVGMAAGGVISMVMVMLSKVFDAPILGTSAWTVYFSMYGSRCLYQYLKFKNNSWLFKAIVGIAAAIVFLVATILIGLKK